MHTKLKQLSYSTENCLQFRFSAIIKVSLDFLPQKVGIDPIISYTNFYRTIRVYYLILLTASRCTLTVPLTITDTLSF